ncbi:MAG: sugar phosphate isomerase/epimerase family protein [Bacillota bacterium]
MRNFLIGMHGGFDALKFGRDYRENFWGVEICLFPGKKDLDRLRELRKKTGFHVGVHFPPLQGAYLCRDPLLWSPDPAASGKAFEDLEAGLDLASLIPTDYLLVHFPKPIILKENLDWGFWKFDSRAEWIRESDYPCRLFRKKCREAFGRLEHLSEKHGIQILLEIDAVNEYIYDSDLLRELLDGSRAIKLCLDTGRLYLLGIVDAKFNATDFVRKYAPYTDLIHLWNACVEDETVIEHFPALQNLRSADGWGDMAVFLEILAAANPDMKILFEHRSDLISLEELESCYQWVDRLFAKYRKPGKKNEK